MSSAQIYKETASRAHYTNYVIYSNIYQRDIPRQWENSLHNTFT